MKKRNCVTKLEICANTYLYLDVILTLKRLGLKKGNNDIMCYMIAIFVNSAIPDCIKYVSYAYYVKKF